MGLYNRFCKRFFAAVIVRTTAQADSRAHYDQAPAMNWDQAVSWGRGGLG